MKYYLILSYLLITIYSCTSPITGSGRIITEKRSTDKFDEIETSSSISIEVRTGETLLVEVEADDNIASHIVTQVKNGRLSVMYEQGSYRNANAKVLVTIPSVKKLLVSGSGSINAGDTLINENKVTVEVNGSGSVEALFRTPEVMVKVDGSGGVDLRGRTKKITINNSGSGSVQAGALLSEEAVVKNSGSGSSEVYASVSLNADLSGSGDIVYSGKPPSTKIDDDGSGSVRDKN